MSIKNNYLSSLTPEQREEARKLGQETKKRKQEESLSWKHDWLDRPLWEFLRSSLKIRAIPSYIHCSETKYIRRTLKQIGKDRVWWQEHFFPRYEMYAEHNPLVPMYVLQGLMLEAAHPEMVVAFRTGE